MTDYYMDPRDYCYFEAPSLSPLTSDRNNYVKKFFYRMLKIVICNILKISLNF